MKPRIAFMKAKKLIGKRRTLSIVDNTTGLLWASFGPGIKEIKNTVSTDKISMQLYDTSYFTDFKPSNTFEKWATVEVSDFNDIPQGMETFILIGGTYAIFDYKGSSDDNSIFDYIFKTWLPGSDYLLDDRPHFEVLGDRYKNNKPSSEEEIWIPIKPRF